MFKLIFIPFAIALEAFKKFFGMQGAGEFSVFMTIVLVFLAYMFHLWHLWHI